MTAPVSTSRLAAADPPVSAPTRAGALITLLAGSFALGLSDLLAPGVVLLAMVLTVVVGVGMPCWTPELLRDSRHRTGLAVLALTLLVVATALSGPAALTSGRLAGDLAAAAGQLALPIGVPIGLLAALAGGSLVAVAAELSDRRGVQSALVLSIAVLGLASVAAPGRHLLPVLVVGWPAALFTLSRMAADLTPSPQAGRGSVRLTEPSVRRRPGLIRWTFVPVIGAIALSCALVAAAVATGVTSQAALTGGSSRGSSDGGPVGRSASDYFGGDMNLNARGPLGTRALFEVPAGSPRLWRAGLLDLYTGESWLATTSPGVRARAVAGTAGEFLLVRDAGAADRSGPTRTDQVHSLLPGWTEVLAPGQVTSIQSPGLIGGWVNLLAGERLTASGPQAALSRYQVRSEVLPMVGVAADTERLLAAGAPSPAEGGPADGVLTEGDDPRWIQLPPGLPSRVRELGLRLVNGAPTRLAAVQAIEEELGRTITYALDSPVPPQGADAVDDVIFSSHSGFCEQFASAEVVLLRSAGVPARVAVGFSAGEPPEGDVRTVRQADAHAWVEVWFPGVGWVSSDPTPAADASVEATWWQSWRATARTALGRPITWVLAGLVLMLVVGAAVRYRRRGARTPADSGSGRRVDPDLAAAFARLEADLTARGQGRAPAETVTALARRLPSDPVRQALMAFDRALYAARPPTRDECLAAAAAIDRSLAPVEPPPSGPVVRSRR